MYLTIVQLAESFGVAEGTVEEWIRSEGLPCIRDGARRSFDRAQVAAWAAARGLAVQAGFLAGGVGPGADDLPLADFLRTGGVHRDVASAQVLDVLAACLARLPVTGPQTAALLAGRLHAAGGVNWAPIGGGLALPHLRAPVALGRRAGLLAIIFLTEPAVLPEPAPDAEPVTRLVFFLAPSPRAHLQLVAQLSRRLMQGPLRALLQEAAPDEALLAALAEPLPETAAAGRRTRGTSP